MFFSTFGLTGCFDALFDNGPAGIVHYFHPNHVGSVRMITDRLGNVVAKFRYKPYGELLVDRSFGIDQSKYKYTGQEEDSTTGLYYYNSRFYAPPVGRFISPDSVIPDPTNTQAFNRYMYAYGNPVRYNDPTGSYGEPGYSNPGDPGGYLGMVNAYSEGSGNPSAVSPGANTGSTVYGYGETPSLGARIVAFISGLFNSNGALPPSNVNYNLLEAELNGNEGSISSFLSWVWGKISSNNPGTATSPGGGWSTFAQYASKGAGYGRLATSSVGLVLRGPTISDFVLNRALTNLPTFTSNSQLAIYGRTLIALDNIGKAVPYLGFVFLTISLTSNSYLTYSGQMSPLSFSVNTGVNLLGLAAGPEIGIPLSVLNMMYGQDVVNVTENSANLIYESSHHGSIEGFVGDMIFNLYAH